MKANFVPAYKYIKEKGESSQNIYRWIREGKIPADKFRKVEKIVERIEIDLNYDPPKKRKKN